MNIKLTVDSTCDIDIDRLKENNVGIAYLKAIDNQTGKEYTDRGISNEELTGLLVSGHRFTTSCPSMADYEKLFTEGLKTHDYVIHLNMSGKTSKSYETAVMTSREVNPDKISVFDTKQFTTGFGGIVLAVIDCLKETKDIKEALHMTEDYINRYEFLGAPNTIKYITKTGRIDATKIAIASAALDTFNLKVQVKMIDGVLTPINRIRGTSIKSAIDNFGSHLQDISNIDTDRIVLGYTDNVEDVDTIIDGIPNIKMFRTIEKIQARTVILAHIGPKTFACSYAKKE